MSDDDETQPLLKMSGEEEAEEEAEDGPELVDAYGVPVEDADLEDFEASDGTLLSVPMLDFHGVHTEEIVVLNGAVDSVLAIPEANTIHSEEPVADEEESAALTHAAAKEEIVQGISDLEAGELTAAALAARRAVASASTEDFATMAEATRAATDAPPALVEQAAAAHAQTGVSGVSINVTSTDEQQPPSAEPLQASSGAADSSERQPLLARSGRLRYTTRAKTQSAATTATTGMTHMSSSLASSEEGDGDGGVGDDDEEEMERTIKWYHLALLIYFWTAGGPFGFEEVVASGGGLLALIGIVGVAVVWALPQALMSAELSLMMEANGANLLWISRAFGPFAYAVNAANSMLSSLISNAMFVVLFVEYLPMTADWSELQKFGLRSAFVLFIVLVNFGGQRIVALVNVLILPLLFLPFLAIPFVWGPRRWAHGDWQSFVAMPSPILGTDIATYISTLIWCFGGFDSLGAAAGEVSGGISTYAKGIAASFPLIICNYIVPVLAVWPVQPDYRKWHVGSFTDIPFVAARWLGLTTVVIASLSQVGQLNSATVPLARQLWRGALAKGHHQLLPRVFSLSVRTRGNVIQPVAAIVVASLASLALSRLKFDVLANSYLLFRLVNLAFEFGSLVALRVREPHTPRPFRVPGGLCGVSLLVLPFCAVAVVGCVVSSPIALYAMAVVQPLVIGAYGLRTLVNHRRRDAARRRRAAARAERRRRLEKEKPEVVEVPETLADSVRLGRATM